MIVARHPRWIWPSLLPQRGSALTNTAPRILVVILVGWFVSYAELDQEWLDTGLTVTPFSLIGLALSIFLGFRNNTAYDRFWEGRKLWGQLVNSSRTFAREVYLYVDAYPSLLHTELVRSVQAYVHVLRQHLRDETPGEGVEGLIPEELRLSLPESTNAPQKVLMYTVELLDQAHHGGRVKPVHLVELERNLLDMTGEQGGCERIKATPIPHSYTVLIHRLVVLYCIGLPFGIVDAVGHWTPIVSAIVAYAFFSLDEVGGEIENPFGHDPNDLPLLQISTNIQRNLAEMIGDPIPPAIQPVDRLLN